METLNPGDRIRITFLDTPAETVEATVCSTLSDQQEGLGPEIEEYVACWLEVSYATCDDPSSRHSVALGTDFQYTLDGRKLTIARLAL